MENDIRTETYENLIDINKYFQLDFSKQTIKGNRKFEEFKKQKLNELGKDAKLFHCKNDNIYFYVSKAECEKYDDDTLYYIKKCPLCNNFVCYFCKRNCEMLYSGECCVKSRLNYLFFYVGFESFRWERCLFGPKLTLLFILMPFTNVLMLFLAIALSLFFLLKQKKEKIDNDLFLYGIYFLENKTIHFIFISILFILTYILFGICFFLWHSFLMIILLIISLFTEFYPIKYYLKIIIGGLIDQII